MPCWYRDLAKFVLRAALAAVFLLHGWAKLGAWQNPDGSALMKALFVVETLGGLLVLLGLWTRWAAAALVVVMAGAIHAKITQMGIGFMGQQATGWEFDLINLAAAFALTGIGAGCFSLDGFLCKGEKAVAPKKKKK